MAKFAKIIKENNKDLLIKKFIQLFKSKISKNRKKRFSLVLAGGKSPIKLYKKLAKENGIAWKNIDFFISDERYVKENSKYSNIKMCRENILKTNKIKNKQVHAISINKKSIKLDANNYEKKIKKYFKNKKAKFDLILLGIGNDGHIASLFKKNIYKKTNQNVSFVRKGKFSRITLTLKCINNSRSIFLWVPGKKKISIIKKILADKIFKYPVSFLKKKNNFLFYSN